jgi:hypothetical protein
MLPAPEIADAGKVRLENKKPDIKASGAAHQLWS